MVHVKEYKKPEYNINEVLRYMCCKRAEEAVQALLAECISELGERLSFKVCAKVLPVCFDGGSLDFGVMRVQSNDLAKNLRGCDKAVLFAATVGLEIDRLIARYGVISPSRSVAFQAIGAERIESLCDLFEDDVRAEAEKHGKFLRPRFSAGYGDFEISAQKRIFDILDCRRKIGLTLNDSLLMSPSKSVTAIIGISDTPPDNCAGGCVKCGKTDCMYRRKEK